MNVGEAGQAPAASRMQWAALTKKRGEPQAQKNSGTKAGAVVQEQKGCHSKGVAWRMRVRAARAGGYGGAQRYQGGASALMHGSTARRGSWSRGRQRERTGGTPERARARGPARRPLVEAGRRGRVWRRASVEVASSGQRSSICGSDMISATACAGVRLLSSTCATAVSTGRLTR